MCNFKSLKIAIKIWIKDINIKYKSIIETEVLQDNNNMFRVIFHLNTCLAEIIVNKSPFVPYKNISFEALDIIENTPKLIYFWYRDNETINETINKLNESINFIINYKKD